MMASTETSWTSSMSIEAVPGESVMSNAAVAFVSALAVELTSDRLSTVMADAARFNEEVGVTGVTLFDGFRFLSYMEGPVDGLSAAFLRTSGTSTHSEGQERAWPRCLGMTRPN